MELDGRQVLQAMVRDITGRKRAEEKLRSTLAETERVNRLMPGRETRIHDLKKEVHDLLKELGRDSAYESAADSSDERIDVIETETAPAPRAAVWNLLSTGDQEIVDCGLEKPDVDLAFIPILCSAPLLYAKSHGIFARNGLDVKLRPAPGWSGAKGGRYGGAVQRIGGHLQHRGRLPYPWQETGRHLSVSGREGSYRSGEEPQKGNKEAL